VHTQGSQILHKEIDAKYAVIGDGSNLEASSVTLFFKLTLQATSGDIVSGGPVLKGQKINSQNLNAFPNVCGLVLVLTRGCFENPEFLAMLTLASRMINDACVIQPIVADKSFQFPDSDFYTEMETTGAPVAQSVEVFEATINFCWDHGVEEPITSSEVAAVAQKTLRRIAVPFDINYSNEQAIAQETQTVLSRLQPTSRSDSLMSSLMANNQVTTTGVVV